jgi:TldD protein
MLGKRIASPLVSASSDASIPGYGHFRYDSEGVKARKVVHIERGILKALLNSRETAYILGGEPVGAMRCEDSSLVPLIRMTNTFFEPGTDDNAKILAEVDNGYLLEGHRTPSISESRENFRISARRTWRIVGGRKEKLFRGGSIMADSGAYLMSIDAVGRDWKLFPVPNCGKGQPMQIMRVGNGGPTMRGRAKITGGAA